jgi:hypothetical protein
MLDIRVHPICFYSMKKDPGSGARPYTDSNGQLSIFKATLHSGKANIIF